MNNFCPALRGFFLYIYGVRLLLIFLLIIPFSATANSGGRYFHKIDTVSKHGDTLNLVVTTSLKDKIVLTEYFQVRNIPIRIKTKRLGIFNPYRKFVSTEVLDHTAIQPEKKDTIIIFRTGVQENFFGLNQFSRTLPQELILKYSVLYDQSIEQIIISSNGTTAWPQDYYMKWRKYKKNKRKK